MKTVWDALVSNAPAFGIMGALFLFATRSIVRDEIRKLNGTYLRKEIADTKFAEIEKHFDYIRDQRASAAHGD